MGGIDVLSALEGRPTSVLIADQLRDRIIDGSFHPGEQVTEAQLAARLQVSRGPVREALQRLSQEGLLISHRNRGVFVLDLGPDDVAEIYSARAAVELGAAEEILESGEDVIDAVSEALSAVLKQMPAVVAASDWKSLSGLDLGFHQAFVAGANNSRLSRIYHTLAAESRICMVNLEVSYPRAGDLVSEHQRLLDLLRGRDHAALDKEIRTHMSSAVRDLTASMRAQLSAHDSVQDAATKSPAGRAGPAREELLE